MALHNHRAQLFYPNFGCDFNGWTVGLESLDNHSETTERQNGNHYYYGDYIRVAAVPIPSGIIGASL